MKLALQSWFKVFPFCLALNLFFHFEAYGKIDGFNPDPNARIFFVSDADETLFHNLGSYVVKLNRHPGLAGIIRVGGLSEEEEIPVQDYEGTAGLRLKDKFGRYEGGHFIQGNIEPVKLANGKTIIPGY